MKYQDKYLTVKSDNIVIFDIDRPTPALLELFNPTNNHLPLQAVNAFSKSLGYLANSQTPISLGVATKSLHCLIPALMYLRSNPNDQYYTVSNHLVIKDTEFASEIIQSNIPKFFDNTRDLVEQLFSAKNRNYLVFDIDQKESIATAIDLAKKSNGVISVLNPEYKNPTIITKYILEKELIPCENVDGSIDLFCN